MYRPDDDSPEMQYHAGAPRRSLGGYVPIAQSRCRSRFTAPPLDIFKDSLHGSNGRDVSTTGAFNGVLSALLKHEGHRQLIVPIIPDEARTFGMDGLFRQIGIYSSKGQLYQPVDNESFLYYKEAKDGQLFEEGITEAGSMATFTAAGTAYANLRRSDDSVLHLLLDVRLPAHRRSGLGVCRLPWQGLHDGRHGGPHDALGRRPAASGRSQSRCWPAPFRPALATIRPMRMRSRSSCRTACGACTRRRKTSSTT